VPVARLGVSCPDGVDGAVKVGLRARNASVTWTAAASRGLDVFPAGGSIKAGGSVSIWVTVIDPDSAGSGRVSFTSNGGGASCSLSWDGSAPQATAPPTDEPTAAPEPTESPTGPRSSSQEDTEAGKANTMSQ
jgi:hypothetical protein